MSSLKLCGFYLMIAFDFSLLWYLLKEIINNWSGNLVFGLLASTTAMFITSLFLIKVYPMHEENAEKIRECMRPELKELKHSLTTIFLVGLVLGVTNLLLKPHTFSVIAFFGPFKLLPDSFVCAYLILTLIKYCHTFLILDKIRNEHEKFDPDFPRSED
ncbi:MAG: hypothetical protein IAB19_00390 [Proteobacteria bacterium]|uniref:Uncharacterized protein n=1 Tax=Candidatus Avisuccinivibrio stercorigallinarum TaxID=2840704 RepID=A0A9D9D9H8_9GAMM|nr:hypothetical protein [Candidatus Avisuccinivibrio stercorigallinarum]